MANKKERFSPQFNATREIQASFQESEDAQFVYNFGDGKADGDGTMKPLLGGKGANLAEMTRIGLPVPPGFTITTEVCTYFYAHKRTYPAVAPGADGSRRRATWRRSWAPSSATPKGMPLLVAVRSGARDSMPGMMDTILNLGLNDQTVMALATATKNERFAWDCYRRFIQMYGDVVHGRAEARRRRSRAVRDRSSSTSSTRSTASTTSMTRELDAPTTSRNWSTRFKKLVKERTGKAFPNDPWEQLRGAAGAVFGSWMNDRAIVYRRKYNIPQRVGHGRQRAGDGLRQHRRELRLRRGLHPQPGQRRERILRRIPDQRAGRRRRRRRAHAASRSSS